MDILGLIIIIWHDTWSFIKQDKGTTFPPEKEKAMRKNGTPEKVSKEKTAVHPRVEMHIPFLAGRPPRESNINHDDCTNLQIAFYTSRTLDEFLEVT